MFGLDDWIAGLSDGASLLVVLLVAALLGLRHATDPDHIAARCGPTSSRRGEVLWSAFSHRNSEPATTPTSPRRGEVAEGRDSVRGG